MNIEEQRQYAAELVLAHAQDVEYLSVFEMAEEYHDGEISDEDGWAVHDLIGTAVVTVSFPDCDLEWSNQDEEDEQAETAPKQGGVSQAILDELAAPAPLRSDPCPYTHSHTRHFCGRVTCRES